MGAQGIFYLELKRSPPELPSIFNMAPTPKKAMKAPAKAMTKGAMAKALAEEHEIKASVASKIINSLAEIGTKEVTGTGKFTFPGLCMIKTRVKPATKACNREIFGKMCDVKARPARTIVKAFPAAALKKQF